MFTVSNGSANGWLNTGIWFGIRNNFGEPIDSTIENNMIWYVNSGLSGVVAGRGPITVTSTNPGVVVQNNTIYNSKNAINASGASHVIRNNVVEQDIGNAAVYLFSSASGSTVINNNLRMVSPTGNVAAIEGGAIYSCDTVGGLGTGNKCAPSLLKNVGDPNKANWDLHLDPGDGANIDVLAFGTQATWAKDDFDRDLRPFPAGGRGDLGADEARNTSVTVTAISEVLDAGGGAAPTNAGQVVLRANSWTVRVTASRSVVRVPSPLVFVDSQGGTSSITLAGQVPGTVFTGTFTVDASVAEGIGHFELPQGSLDDGQGNTGNQITQGREANIDQHMGGQSTLVVLP
jgi:hypothetical protein